MIIDTLVLVLFISLVASLLVFLTLAVFRRSGDRDAWDKSRRRYAYLQSYHQDIRRNKKRAKKYDKAQYHRVSLKPVSKNQR